MPICPRCSATIHAGADDQCPACSYNLLAANKLFGEKKVAFSRVVDAAGALNQEQLEDLRKYLAKIERYIPPVALCVYITNDGFAKDFRQHAHWILNHAHIHRASFGARDDEPAPPVAPRAAEEDAEEEEQLAAPEPAHTGWLTRALTRLRDAFLPKVPPPTQQRWMLILVLDVQLEYACFSWGYQLDPYVNPDSINSCILAAKFQFRERALLTALKKVMKGAAREIAAESRRVNADLRRRGRLRALPLLLGAALALAAPTPAHAAPEGAAEAATPTATAAPQPAPAEGTAEAAPPAPPAVAAEPGAPASYSEQPRWEDEDYRHLMNGELKDACNMLFPPADKPRADKRLRPAPAAAQADKAVPAAFHDEYKKYPTTGLIDPQRLLSVEEARDVEHVLREFNGHSNFRIHVALYPATQNLPADLAVHQLAQSTARAQDYMVMLLYPLGNSQLLDLGYARINPQDDERHEWLAQVREAAAPEGNGVESLLLAIRRLYELIEPISSTFQVTREQKIPAIERVTINIPPPGKVKEDNWKKKLKDYLTDEQNHPLFIKLGVLAALIAGFFAALYYFRRSGVLLESREDARLASPYGAGVSRHVRYLQGQESTNKPVI